MVFDQVNIFLKTLEVEFFCEVYKDSKNLFQKASVDVEVGIKKLRELPKRTDVNFRYCDFLPIEHNRGSRYHFLIIFLPYAFKCVKLHISNVKVMVSKVLW